MSKRDGRREWLRATKLARSIAAALAGADGAAADGAVADGAAADGAAADGLAADGPAADAPGAGGDLDRVAVELAAVVLAALRQRWRMVPFAGDAEPSVSTVEIAAAVERALWASGRPQAAVRYAAVRGERVARVAVLARPGRRDRADVMALHARVTFDHN